MLEPRPELTITSFDEKEANEFVEKLSYISATYGPEQAIIVRVDSYGGNMHGLANIYEHLKATKNPIITYCTSKAMSAGAIILATAGSPGMRFATPTASIMLHEVSAGAFGHVQDMEVDMDMTRAMNVKWMGILAKSMGLNSIQDIRDLISKRATGRDLYLTAEEAKELKIIDDVASLDICPIIGYNITVNSLSPQKKGKSKK